MKLHTPPEPIEVIRMTFRKQKHKYEYIMVQEATLEEVEKFLKKTIASKIKIDPFYTGNRVGIDIRHYVGGKAGKSKSISFKDSITPKELKEIILKELKK